MFCICLGLFGVAMARHGLILRENKATGSRKVFKYLPGLRDAIKKTKMADKVQKPRIAKSLCFPYISIWGRRHGRSPIL